MSRCQVCGTQNSEVIDVCQRCGATLATSPTMSISPGESVAGERRTAVGPIAAHDRSPAFNFAPGSTVAVATAWCRCSGVAAWAKSTVPMISNSASGWRSSFSPRNAERTTAGAISSMRKCACRGKFPTPMSVACMTLERATAGSSSPWNLWTAKISRHCCGGSAACLTTKLWRWHSNSVPAWPPLTAAAFCIVT